MKSHNPYLRILATKRAYIFAFAALPARAVSSMYGLAIFMMMQQLLAAKDAVIAIYLTSVFLLGMALFSPVVGKLTDKYGQAAVLKKILLLNTCAVVSLLTCVYWQLPYWTLFVAVLALSFLPSVGSLSRARWVNLFGKKRQLNTAFALEALIDEINFLVGSPLAIFLATYLFASAGVVVAFSLFFIGTIVLISHKVSEPPPSTVTTAAAPSNSGAVLVFQASMLALIVFSFVLGITFGVVEVMAVKFAVFHGFDANAGALILALYSIGSFASGYLFGIYKAALPTEIQFFYWSAAKALLCVIVGLLSNFWLLCAVMVLLGITLAPVLTLAIRMINIVVAKNQITEGISWFSSAIALGTSAGVALVGLVISRPALGVAYGLSINSVMGVFLLCAAAVVVKAARKKGS